MKNFPESDEIVQAVAYAIDSKLSSLKEESNRGTLSSEKYGLLIGTALKITDEWSTRLTYLQKLQILNWFKDEYGIVN